MHKVTLLLATMLLLNYYVFHLELANSDIILIANQSTYIQYMCVLCVCACVRACVCVCAHACVRAHVCVALTISL